MCANVALAGALAPPASPPHRPILYFFRNAAVPSMVGTAADWAAPQVWPCGGRLACMHASCVTQPVHSGTRCIFYTTSIARRFSFTMALKQRAGQLMQHLRCFKINKLICPLSVIELVPRPLVFSILFSPRVIGLRIQSLNICFCHVSQKDSRRKPHDWFGRLYEQLIILACLAYMLKGSCRGWKQLSSGTLLLTTLQMEGFTSMMEHLGQAIASPVFFLLNI